jgi:pyruvate ferredoxin oxidoreductase gamma subunit
MFQVRIHGRGGQGVVTAAELLSVAAFMEGKHAQAFPSFGSERMGAPVTAFCRIDDREIRSREPIMTPDALIIQDPTLLHSVDVFDGLTSTGFLLINSTKGFEALGIESFVIGLPSGHARSVAATELALEQIGRPIPNAALLGAFAALTGLLHLEAVCAAIRERFPGPMGDKNSAAATNAYEAIAQAQPKEAAIC